MITPTINDHASRTAYTCVSVACIIALTTLLGLRLSAILNVKFGRLTCTRCLVLILDIIAIAFVATAAVLESGLDLTTMASCRAAVYACLAFYFTFKGAIQVFLVERLHVLRRTGQRRLEDRYWTGGSTMVFCGFGVIAVIAFLWPNAALSSSDGKCLIGLPNKVLIPLLTYDIFINVGLTTLFVLLLLPYLRLRDILLHQPSTKKQTVERAVVQRGNVNPVPANSGHAIEILTTTSVETWSENTRCSPKSATSSCQMVRTCPSCKRVKVRSNNLWKLVIRSLCGSVMVLVPTIINLVLIYCWRGKEQGWLCFTVCTLDVTWEVAAIHWVTVGTEGENCVAQS